MNPALVTSAVLPPESVAKLEAAFRDRTTPIRIVAGDSAPAQPKLVTIDRLGGVRGLQFKRGQGFDLRKLGPAHIVRISEVIWSDHAQAWYVRFLQGELKGDNLTAYHWKQVGSPELPEHENRAGLFTFADYEDAVTAEVAFVQAARLTGKYKLA